MPSDRVLEPWRSFLAEIDAATPRPLELHCIGGFAVTMYYELVRATGDLARLTIRHSTLVPGRGIDCDCEPTRPAEPALEIRLCCVGVTRPDPAASTAMAGDSIQATGAAAMAAIPTTMIARPLSKRRRSENRPAMRRTAGNLARALEHFQRRPGATPTRPGSVRRAVCVVPLGSRERVNLPHRRRDSKELILRTVLASRNSAHRGQSHRAAKQSQLIADEVASSA